MTLLHALAIAVWLLFGATLVVNLVYLASVKRAPRAEHASVTIVIPARNEAANLRRLLPSLWQQMHTDFSVVVVNDSSEDDTAKVLAEVSDSRLRVVHSDGLPPGWVGKTHAIYQGTRELSTELVLFLDADTALTGPHALERLVDAYSEIGGDVVMGGVLRYRGGGLLLVSAIPFSQLTALPLFLPPLLGKWAPAGLGGQCWMMRTASYQAHEPHLALCGEVLEDVRIGHYLRRRNVIPYTRDLRHDVAVWMYSSHADAWRGFRKNSYLFIGGEPLRAGIVWLLFVAVFIAAPLYWWPLLVAQVLLKAITDMWIGWLPILSLFAPVTMIAGGLLQLDSARVHLLGRPEWKGRIVGRAAIGRKLGD